MTTENTTHFDPWEATMQNSSAEVDPQIWLQGSVQANSFDWLHPFNDTLIPFGHWVEIVINWLVAHLRTFFVLISTPIDYILTVFQSSFNLLPPTVMMVIFTLIVWQFSTFRLAVMTLLSFIIIGAIGAWSEMMITLALVLTAVS
ncbi:MAG TPA: proline/glycine betaine ABC transporter permease ProW, partial [Pasteurellaceae bacterium]|nr:proline/glycine betaine ABC transporter permease ProW [Pasteurellaceae bacterium]